VTVIVCSDIFAGE